MNLECKMDHILKTKNQKIVFYRFQNIRGEGGTMEQGEQWDSKHSRKNQQRNEVHLLLVKVLSIGCACHKKVDFIPLYVFSRMLAVPLFPLFNCIALSPTQVFGTKTQFLYFWEEGDGRGVHMLDFGCWSHQSEYYFLSEPTENFVSKYNIIKFK